MYGDLCLTSPRYQRELFTVNETLAALAFMRDAYFSIGNASVANYEYERTPGGDVTPMEMRVTRLLPSGALDSRAYNVTADPSAPIGPFDPALAPWQQKRLLRSLRAVHFAFFLQDSQFGNYYKECFRWHVHVSFKMVESAQLRAEVDESHVAHCSSRSFWSALRQRFVWLHVVIALVALVYLALSAKALRRSFVTCVSRSVRWLLESGRELWNDVGAALCCVRLPGSHARRSSWTLIASSTTRPTTRPTARMATAASISSSSSSSKSATGFSARRSGRSPRSRSCSSSSSSTDCACVGGASPLVPMAD